MSPSMRTDNAAEQGNYACCVYVNERKNKCDVGVAPIDVSTEAMDVFKSCLLDCVSVIAPVIASRTVSEVILIGSEIVKGSGGLLGCVWRHCSRSNEQSGGLRMVITFFRKPR
jgi:hypothetical protein